MDIRVRYPPSPTGLQHIGGVRTALFNYFFARSSGGTFVLRIEDTDQARFDPESLEDLYRTMDWLEIDWDEGPERGGDFGPYVQSMRAEIYQQHASQLIESGRAYRCFCSEERLEALRSSQGKAKGYDRKCLSLDAEESERRSRDGEASVIRLKVPIEGATEFDDLLVGRVRRKNRDINPDPVLMKSDGLPTYHLANVVDDHLMQISHIMRAQEWLPSVPIHITLYEAFDWAPPVYCHLPLVMGKDGQKLGKRHGSTSIREFRDAGYLPEAILNYVSLLGWSYDDQREFFSKDELCELFDINRLNKAQAVFDYKKLDWFNGQYIRRASDDTLTSLLNPYLQDAGFISRPMTDSDLAKVTGMLPLIRQRIKRLDEVTVSARFLFVEDLDYPTEELIPKKTDAERTLELLESGRTILAESTDRSDEEIEEQFRGASERLGEKLGTLLMPVRVAVTGTTASPPLFGSIRLLGIEKSIERIDEALLRLKEHING